MSNHQREILQKVCEFMQNVDKNGTYDTVINDIDEGLVSFDDIVDSLLVTARQWLDDCGNPSDATCWRTINMLEGIKN